MPKVSQRVKSMAEYLKYSFPLKAKPIPRVFQESKDSELSFEGGYLSQVLTKKGYQGWGAGNSGLTDEELTQLNKIFKFQSMGYAEYERGDLGRSFKYLKENSSQLIFSSFILEGHEIYYVCLNYHEKLVIKTIQALLYNAPHAIRMSKSPVDLHKALSGIDKDFVGAWDIKSNFVFFTSKTRFNKFKKVILSENK